MKGNLDEMLTTADELAEASESSQEYEKVVLTSQKGMVQVRVVGDWSSNFEIWVKQQQVPGVPPEQIGQPRKIVSKGYRKDPATGSYIGLDPVATKVLALTSGTDAEKAIWKDSFPKQFFVFNVVPIDMGTRVPDEWCIQNNHAKLLVTNEKGIGINQTLFKAAAGVMKIRKLSDPATKLSSLNLIFTRSGQKLETQYGCQPDPVPDQSVSFDIDAIKTYDPEVVARVSDNEYIYRCTGWWFGEGNPPAITSNAAGSTAAPQPAVAAPPAPALQAIRPQTVAAQHVVNEVPVTPNVVTPAPVPAQASEEMNCPYCQTRHLIEAHMLGQKVMCSNQYCKQLFDTIPF